MPENDSQIVAVVGAGTMGPGVAATIASHGFKVRLYEIKPEVLDRARGTVETTYETLLAADFLTENQVARGKEGLTFTLDQKEAMEGGRFRHRDDSGGLGSQAVLLPSSRAAGI